MDNNRSTLTWRRPWRVAALLLAVALTAAACGGDDESTEAAASAASPDTSESTDESADTTDGDAVESGSDETVDGADDRPADWPTAITFGAVPAEQASSLEADFATTRAILIEELGLEEIEFFQASDYAGIIEVVADCHEVRFIEVRKPKRLHTDKVSFLVIKKLLRVMGFKYWNIAKCLEINKVQRSLFK